MQKLKEIQSKMHKAGVIGIEINKNPKFELEEKSIFCLGGMESLDINMLYITTQ